MAEQTTYFCLNFLRKLFFYICSTVPANKIINNPQEVLKENSVFQVFLISTSPLNTQWAFFTLQIVIAT